MAWRHIKKSECPHLSELQNEATSDKDNCEVCGVKEDLRICLICRRVSCCESHNSHDTEHFKQSGHPFIRPHRTDYDWMWCYKCQAFLD